MVQFGRVNYCICGILLHSSKVLRLNQFNAMLCQIFYEFRWILECFLWNYGDICDFNAVCWQLGSLFCFDMLLRCCLSVSEILHQCSINMKITQPCIFEKPENKVDWSTWHWAQNKANIKTPNFEILSKLSCFMLVPHVYMLKFELKSHKFTISQTKYPRNCFSVLFVYTYWLWVDGCSRIVSIGTCASCPGY